MWRWRRRTDDDFREEIRSNIAIEMDHQIAEGKTPEDARSGARREFGNVTRAQERFYEAARIPWLDDLGQDVRYAFRTLHKNPGFTTVAVLTLALGIGANAAIFSIIRGVLLKPLPYAEADRLVELSEQWPGLSGPRPVSWLNYLDWASQSTVFERMVAVSWGNVTIGDGSPVYVHGSFVSPGYFELFGLRPAIGRTFTSNESDPGHERVVVLSHGLWVSQFGADPAIVGTPVRLDREVYTMIGVMPPRTSVDFLAPQLWRPLTFDALPPRGARQLQKAVARLKHGVTLEQARTEMTVIANRLAREYPDSNQGYGVSVQRYPRPIGFGVEPSLYLLFAAVVGVLLMACVNLANLALVRGSARAREMALRTALGASRTRLVRQLLTEHLLIAAGGVLCATIVGTVMLRTMLSLIPTSGLRAAFPPDTVIAMDAPVWLYALGVSLASGLAFGLAPAVRVTQVTLTDAIKTEGGSSISAGRATRRSRQILVAAQIALAFVLITGATLLIRGFFTLTARIEAGFDSTNVLTAGLPTAPTRFKSDTSFNAYLDDMASRLQALPGIEQVAFTDAVPTQGTPYGKRFQIAGRPPVTLTNRPNTGFKVVSPSYFRAIGLRLVAGRALDERDRDGSPLVVVINEAFARTYFQGIDVVGQRVLFSRPLFQTVSSASGPGRSATIPPVDLEWAIVGVVADESVSPFDNRMAEPAMYATREQHPRSNLALVVRTAGDPASVQESIRKTVAAFDRDQALSDLKTLEVLKAEDVAPDRLRSILLGIFAAIALGLASIGVYGVIAYEVVLRTRELGIRAALGATTGSLVALVARQGATIVVLGLTVGVGTALSVLRLLETFLYGVAPRDPVTIAATAMVIAAVSLIACAVPAMRATRVDPMVALRCE